MELYTSLSKRFARELTLTYSSSFGIASRFFDSSIRPHIFNIYGLVRIADEIVDTYEGSEKERLLDELELDVLRAVRIQYATNPIVMAYAKTATQFKFDPALITAFFKSMRMDLTPFENSEQNYKTYIYGSAEVIGLLCLKVFVNGDEAEYAALSSGAQSLGSAYQKVNFLRDLKADYEELGRTYFPGVSFTKLDESAKMAIVSDIEAEFNVARAAIKQLPQGAKRAVTISYIYYSALLAKLKRSDIEVIKSKRQRISSPHKVVLLALTGMGVLHA